jgi:hypothetical protein
MKFTKKQINKIYDECVQLIKKQKPSFFVFRKMRGIAGLCYDDKLEFDYRKDVIPTMFHECIHFIYPEWSETKVLLAEKRLINNLTGLQITEFLKILSNKLYLSEVKKHERDTF